MHPMTGMNQYTVQPPISKHLIGAGVGSDSSDIFRELRLNLYEEIWLSK